MAKDHKGQERETWTLGGFLMWAGPAQVASDGRVLLKNVTFVELCGVC